MESSTDLIDFLMGLEFFQTHEHLFYLFKLCCLCLTSVSPQYPPVLFGSVDTTGYQGRFADLVVPCQSYLYCVPNSISHCCSDVNLEKFSVLSSSFERSAFSADYDPWTLVDEFGRSKIYKSLLTSYRAVTAVPSTRSVRIEKDTASSIPDDSAIKVPSKKQKPFKGPLKTKCTYVFMYFQTVNFVNFFVVFILSFALDFCFLIVCIFHPRIYLF